MKRYFWLLYLLLITLAAFLAAGMVNAALSARLAAPLRAAKTQANVPSGPLAPASPLAHYEIINKRNVFNANPPVETPAQPTAPEPPPPPPEVVATPLQIKLVGTVAGRGAQRFAIIETTTGGPSQMVYQVGDVVQQVVILDIVPNCVVFDKGGGRREEVCFQPEGSTASTVQQGAGLVPGVPPPAAPAARPGETGAGGIVRVDPGTWRVSRELILENFANVGSLATQARVIPHVVQGQQQGFQLTRLKADGVLPQIGLQEGDVLQKVNGLDIHTPQEALQA
ncbi:MAG: type II secretion system protein GspC, partial [Candidatus Tectimicrobiota bacterium]